MDIEELDKKIEILRDTMNTNQSVTNKSLSIIAKKIGSGGGGGEDSGIQHQFMTESEFGALTASTAEDGVIYISLEGYTGTTAWVLGGRLPITLS